MQTRLFDSDPVTKTRKVFRFDHTDDTYVIATHQDVTDLVEDNLGRFNQVDERARWGEMDRVASIPMPIYMELRRKGIVDDEKAFARWLDDPDNRCFRTRPGKLSK
jgi:hypothetical protein